MGVDTSKLAEQRAAIHKRESESHPFITPITISSPHPCSHPSPLLQGRRIGCVVMAGGQATRLGHALPKGLIPFSPVAGKPLLQLLAEKAVAYSRCYGSTPRLAIMTSEASDGATRAFFEANAFFGVPSIEFFVQPSLPLLNMHGELIVREDGSLLTGPDGNGSVFSSLMRSGILTQWEDEGLDAISIVLVDNPLIDPFYPALFSPLFEGVNLTAAAVERADPDEQVGLFVKEGGRLRVVEYSEIDSSIRNARDAQGRLVFCWANISCFGCSIPFLKAAAALPLPMHVAKKRVDGHEVWKAEYFVFDAMTAARTIEIVPLQRNDYFAPVKDATTLEAARLAMIARDRKRLSQLTGIPADPSAPIELAAAALYPEERFLAYLRGCNLRRGLFEEGAAPAGV